MSQHSIEIILAQRLASHLTSPVFLVDEDGLMLYYNEAAEELIGYRFEETGSVPMEVWSTVLQPTDPHGNPLPTEQNLVVQAVKDQLPGHQTQRIVGLDGVARQLTGAAIPLVGHAGRHMGALTFFWEESA